MMYGPQSVMGGREYVDFRPRWSTFCIDSYCGVALICSVSTETKIQCRLELETSHPYRPGGL